MHEYDHAKPWSSASAVPKSLALAPPSTPPRKRVSFFTPMSVAPADDADGSGSTASSSSCEDGNGGSGTTRDVEHLLPNGDFYTGQWNSGRPHGVGKYLWTDGCMYEGEWQRGKATGRGKFSWPSGATYEGEFKDGFMDGAGTYTGAAGDTYRGFWSMNLKHGNGRKSYANGDYYDGDWRQGLQDGNGRYVWRNGTEYKGSWRAGLIHGKGSLIWSNGNRYDGGWEDGCPRGSGSFRWADGSLYVGVWSSDTGGVQQKGVYYPSSSVSSPTARDPRDAFAADLPDVKVCNVEAVFVLPSQKALNWSGLLDSGNVRTPRSGETRTRQSIDSGKGRERRANTKSNLGSAGLEKLGIWDSEGGGSGEHGSRKEGQEEGALRALRPGTVDARAGTIPAQMRWRPQREPKRQGETISRGHKNFELMLNLQLGIRHAVGKQGPINLELKSSAFDPKDKVWTRFPPEGTKHTPPHSSCDFRWKDYCPVVFRTLRKLFKVDAADYMLSLCGNDALRELSSPGKSGSFFYLTNDDKYMIKTMKKSEVKLLLKMLPAYYNHVRSFENTMVTKFFGLHCVRLTGANQKKVRFVVMGNLFCAAYAIHRRFDLKGSSLGRMTDKPQAEIDEYTTLKDLDLNLIFRLQRHWFQEFQRQVDKDCEFLEQEKVMDYSLLVGVHFREMRDKHATEEAGNMRPMTPRLSRADINAHLQESNRRPSITLGGNMPARAELTARRTDELQLIGEPTGEFYDVILYFGIIDILQDYDISKKLEHAYKAMQYDPTSISAVDPKQYSRRFRDFIYKAFVEDT